MIAISWTPIYIALPTSAQTDPSTSSRFSTNRVLVKPLPGSDLAALHDALGTTVLRAYPAIGDLQVVQLPPGASVTNMLLQFQASGLVEYAEPDYILYALSTIPDDPLFHIPDNDPNTDDQWGMHNTGQDNGTAGADINAPEAWDIRTSAANVIVAVIDTGLWYTHEELMPNLWVNPGESAGGKETNELDDDGNGFVDDIYGINAIANNPPPDNAGYDDPGDPADDYGHGTHVAGIIGAKANNLPTAVGVAGVCWEVKIMACKFLTSGAKGLVSDAIECIDYATQNGAKIINASWGDYTSPPYAGSGEQQILTDLSSNVNALRDAISTARTAGIIFVAACGNSDSNNDDPMRPLYPASYDLDNIIAVAATDRNDQLASFSNFGATTVDLGAPGNNIISSFAGWNYRYDVTSGTSMAAPHVAGACALVWARYSGENYQQIITRVFTAVDPVPSLAGKTKTGGRLNLLRALVQNGSTHWQPTAGLVSQWRSLALTVQKYYGPNGSTGDTMLREPFATAVAELFRQCRDRTAKYGVDRCVVRVGSDRKRLEQFVNFACAIGK